MKDVANVVTDELLVVRQKVQQLIQEETQSPSDAHDAYVSALIGHLFATLLTGFDPGLGAIDKTPEALARALNVIGKKLSVVAGSLDPTADYRIEILRREKSAAE
jgi:hypothetical protein